MNKYRKYIPINKIKVNLKITINNKKINNKKKFKILI